MRDFHLRFAEEWHDDELIVDLLCASDDRFPDKPGAYVLGTSDGTMITYPWASSPVFYIGKAKSLKKRLIQHRNHTQGAVDNHDDNWWPRYQFGASFGAHCAWYTWNDDIAKLEGDLVAQFYNQFGSIPVANSAWPKQIQPESGDREDDG